MTEVEMSAHVAVVALLLLSAAEEPDWKAVQVAAERVAGSVSVLRGRGGNIGVSAGEDGVFLVDDQYAPLTDKVKAAVASISDRPLRFVLNTHWHGDHTGGNENLGNAGVVVVAHENVRRRMSVEQFIAVFNEKVPPAPKGALPMVTFTEAVTFHMNGDDVRCFHVAPAHTDGDTVVHFQKADVIHTGDLFFNGMYPFIDVSSGGSLEGMIAAAEEILAMAGPGTRIIPGHGPLADKAALTAYHDMLVRVRDRVKPLVEAGKSLEEVKAAGPTKDLDERWAWEFITPDLWLKIVYESLAKALVSAR
jgi:glyoxylase-like metal-dependent hydrolase (beta-lactamase superfamily II)